MTEKEIETVAKLSKIQEEIDHYQTSIMDFFGTRCESIPELDQIRDHVLKLAQSIIGEGEFAHSDEFFDRFFGEDPSELMKLLEERTEKEHESK